IEQRFFLPRERRQSQIPRTPYRPEQGFGLRRFCDPARRRAPRGLARFSIPRRARPVALPTSRLPRSIPPPRRRFDVAYPSRSFGLEGARARGRTIFHAWFASAPRPRRPPQAPF